VLQYNGSPPRSLSLGAVGICTLVLGIVSSLILVGREYGYLKGKQETSLPNPSPLLLPSRRSVNAIFRNRSVSLDDYEYLDCTFENVTFQYDGPTQISLIHAKVAAGSKATFGSRNPAIQQAMGALEALLDNAKASEGTGFVPDVTPQRNG
jgi:hypothetical protein